MLSFLFVLNFVFHFSNSLCCAVVWILNLGPFFFILELSILQVRYIISVSNDTYLDNYLQNTQLSLLYNEDSKL